MGNTWGKKESKGKKRKEKKKFLICFIKTFSIFKFFLQKEILYS